MSRPTLTMPTSALREGLHQLHGHYVAAEIAQNHGGWHAMDESWTGRAVRGLILQALYAVEDTTGNAAQDQAPRQTARWQLALTLGACEHPKTIAANAASVYLSATEGEGAPDADPVLLAALLAVAHSDGAELARMTKYAVETVARRTGRPKHEIANGILAPVLDRLAMAAMAGVRS